MKTLNVKPGLLPTTIHVPASKSYANRALILAALKPSLVSLVNIPDATDVTFLVDALKKIGLDVSQNDSVVKIKNSFPSCEKSQGAEIDIGEGGTTARFLASLLLLGSAPYTLILGDRLKERPWNEFIVIAKNLGAQVSLNGNKLLIQGPITFPSVLEVDCSQTSQVASGLQLVASFLKCSIVPKNLVSSRSYWDMTVDLIEHFRTADNYAIPLDWSSASYPLAFGALKQEIFLPGLFPDPFQADSHFFTILSEVHGVVLSAEGVTVVPMKTKKDFKIDASNCLDLVPALSFLLAHVEGTHHISGIKNLIYKESDRLKEIQLLLGEFGKKTSSDGETLTINGSMSRMAHPVDLSLPDDHRMVMAGALFLKLHQGGTVSPISSVNKSYPGFINILS